MDDFEKMLAGTTENTADTDDLFDDGTKKEADVNVQQSALGGEFDISSLSKGIKTDVDLVICMDVTGSMQPIIDTVKGMALSLYDDIVAALNEKKRIVEGFRVKVIAFRDYYCDGEYAMDESRFFNLPEETAEFSEYVLNLKADGGGDEPENALEALALAMRSDWVKAVSANEKARNIIVMYTDASAHPFEKAQDGVTKFYPKNMLTSLEELKLAWEGQNSMDHASVTDLYRMDPLARRLVIYSPLDSYPWNEIANMPNVKTCSIEPAKGGRELDREVLLKDIAGSIK